MVHALRMNALGLGGCGTAKATATSTSRCLLLVLCCASLKQLACATPDRNLTCPSEKCESETLKLPFAGHVHSAAPPASHGAGIEEPPKETEGAAAHDRCADCPDELEDSESTRHIIMALIGAASYLLFNSVPGKRLSATQILLASSKI